MRKLFYTLVGLGALALMASCNREAEFATGEGGATVKVSFTVQLPDAVETKAYISDGGSATELLFKVYDQSNKHLPNLDQTVTVSSHTATVTANLVKGVKYQYVFWAQKPGQYTLNADDATLTITPATMMNSDAWDAFYWHEPLAEVTAAFSKSITLRRPFAQINVGAPVTLNDSDERTGGDFWAASQSAILIDANLTTSYSIEVPDKLNLLDGSVDGAADVVMTAAAHPAEFLTVEGVKYDYAAMAYVLAGTESSTKDLVLKLNTKQNGTDIELTRNIPNVPMRRNYRTNILGNVFTVTGTFNIIVDQNFYPDTLGNYAYGDEHVPDYVPTYADLTGLNAALASGIDAVALDIASGTKIEGDIVLPETADNIYLYILNDHKDDESSINIKYADGAVAKPANLYVYAKNLYEMNGTLPETHVEIYSYSFIETGTLHTSSSTLVIRPYAYYGNLKIIGGSLRVEGTVAKATVDPMDESEAITVNIIKDAGQEINGHVIVLNVNEGDVEVVATSADGGAPTFPAETEGGVIAAVDTVYATGGSVTIADGASVETVQQEGEAAVEIENADDVTTVEAEDPSKISGEGAKDVEYLITSEAQLTAAVTAKLANIKIGADFTCTKGYDLDFDMVIDLNEHSIKFEGVAGAGRYYTAENFTQSRAFKITGSANFTLKNGKVLLNEALLGAVRFNSTGTLTMKDVYTDNYRGWGLNVKLEDGTAILENVTVESHIGGGIEVNGPAVATLTNCKFTQTGVDEEPWISTAVSVAYGGKLTLVSGTYSGTYGAFVYSTGGTINLNGGSIAGDSASIILQRDNTANHDAVVNVTTGVTSTGKLVASQANCFLNISGGKFNKGKADELFGIQSDASANISGGSFSDNPEEYLAEGYIVRENSEGMYQVDAYVQYDSEKTPYQNAATLRSIISNAADGATVYISEGTYKFTTSDNDRIFLNKDKKITNLTLVGLGNGAVFEHDGDRWGKSRCFYIYSNYGSSEVNTHLTMKNIKMSLSNPESNTDYVLYVRGLPGTAATNFVLDLENVECDRAIIDNGNYVAGNKITFNLRSSTIKHLTVDAAPYRDFTDNTYSFVNYDTQSKLGIYFQSDIKAEGLANIRINGEAPTSKDPIIIE